MKLPENVRNAIDMSKLKAKHSPFYYRMRDLSAKISIYKTLFDNRIPQF